MSLGVIAAHDVIGGGGASAYTTAVLADSPVVYLKLDETSGTTATDSSGNSHNGTYSAGITLGASSLLTDGTGKAAQFTLHTSTGIAVPTGSFLNVSALTVEALVKFSSATDVTSGDAIVSRYGGGGTSWLLWRNTAGKLALQIITAGSGTVNVTGTTSPVLGTKYDVGATWDGSTAKLFVNGTQEASVAATGALSASTEALRLGAYSSSSATVPGMTLDEVSFYNTALSGTRMAAHAAAA